MKNFYFLIIGLFLLASCGSNEKPESDYNGAAITINQAIE
jgi:uncharacterized protein YcfL